MVNGKPRRAAKKPPAEAERMPEQEPESQDPKQALLQLARSLMNAAATQDQVLVGLAQREFLAFLELHDITAKKTV